MDYTPFIQKAHRMIVHDVLEAVSCNGIDEDSAYYITFQTNREDVIVPDFVRARYPHEMTIVLENQFQGLTVSDTGFSVELSFGGVSACISVPFNALTQFADTKSEFGFVLTPIAQETTTTHAKIMSLDELRAMKDNV